MIDITEEIEAVERMIVLLYRCLKINIKTCNRNGVISCLEDIRTCQKEVQRLKATKAVSGLNKGILSDVLQ